MPAAAALIVASLAALDPASPRIERPLVMIETRWSLSASPHALAVAQGPPVGPGQAVQPVAPPPAAKRPDDFDSLEDPAAPAAPGAPATADPAPAAAEAAPAEAAPAEAAPADAAATDPLEDELASEIKPADDPLEGFNRISFSVSMAIDKALLRPLALTYKAITPKPARDGIRNVLSNLGEPMVFINDILQLKPKRAIRTLGRFLINTVLGLGGLFDIARDKKFGLPHHPNRLSNTLGFYGVKPGPYIYIPILGPATLRDQVDRVPGLAPWYDDELYRGGRGTAATVVSGLQERADNDAALKALLDDAIDPYATFRATWLQERQGEIDRLKVPDGQEPAGETNPLDTPLEDPAAAAPGAATPAP